MKNTKNEVKYYSLRDIKETIGISRRVVQGYEELDLVVPTCKNHMGHLLYDQEMYDRIKLIHEYQWLGFTLKEVKVFIDADESLKKKYYEERRKMLQDEKKQLILKAARIMELLS
ncbi:MAG: MerR family transcriptional regulator [Lachnospiraceae bacterium]|nr:MerR family transcriptional regulator [Lachnospiraceae bacterium]